MISTARIQAIQWRTREAVFCHKNMQIRATVPLLVQSFDRKVAPAFGAEIVFLAVLNSDVLRKLDQVFVACKILQIAY